MHLKYLPLPGNSGAELDAFFKLDNGFVQVQPGGVVLPRKFCEIGQQIVDATVRASDVWLVSFPRSGSTWAQELVWLLGNRLDYAGAKHLQLLRTPLLELTAILYEHHNEWLTTNAVENSAQLVEQMPSPRFIKTHLPWNLLPRQLNTVEPKIIYIARNPKDQCVSYYHYATLVHGIVGTFEQFCELFLAERAPYGPMWPHVLGFWQRRHQPNILFLKYEDMKRDLGATVRECAAFLEVDAALLTAGNVEALCEYLKFSRMQKNPAVNLEPVITADTMREGVKFIRKGMVGDWKNHMTAEMSARFDEWIAVNTAGTDLTFDYEE